MHGLGEFVKRGSVWSMVFVAASEPQSVLKPLFSGGFLGTLTIV
jgi:hypothetical protein